jgi:hypothetical protein
MKGTLKRENCLRSVYTTLLASNQRVIFEAREAQSHSCDCESDLWQKFGIEETEFLERLQAWESPSEEFKFPKERLMAVLKAPSTWQTKKIAGLPGNASYGWA